MEYLPYTYLIGWTSINKWYYGVEYGIKKFPCANPENLWTTYFTSSKIVSYFRKTYGEPDVVQVRRIFSNGSWEERMEESINWEKRVLSKINIVSDIWLNGRIGGNVCPVANKKIAMSRYGVENVFQSLEIKEKIKNTNLRKYGVEHPSYSLELLEKKKENNIKKYGVGCTLNFPHVREKAMKSCDSETVRLKRRQTILNVYGVNYISQNQEIKNRILKKRSELSNRERVRLIREYKRVFKITLKEGWYQLDDEKLDVMLTQLYQKHGTFTFEELSKVEVIKKYSASIKMLQERNLVKQIKKYKEKYKRRLKLGRNWDRKSEEKLKLVLQELTEIYGII